MCFVLPSDETVGPAERPGTAHVLGRHDSYFCDPLENMPGNENPILQLQTRMRTHWREDIHHLQSDLYRVR